ASFLHAMQDPGVGCLGYAAWTLWSLGYPDQALTQSHEALTLTQHRSHPYSLTWSRFFTAVVHMLRREFHAVQELAEAIITSATAHEFRLWEAEGTFLRGRSLARQGQDKEGIVQMRQGLASLQATGATLGMTGRLARLAEVYGNIGQPEEGLPLIAEAFAQVERTSERFWEAETHRLKGELLLQQSSDNGTEAEACFQQAITVARSQQAKSWELRAATSLARLWQQQGKRQEAHDL